MNNLIRLVKLAEETGTSDKQLRQLMLEQHISDQDIRKLFKMIVNLRKGVKPKKARWYESQLSNIVNILQESKFDNDVLAWNNRLNEGPKWDSLKRKMGFGKEDEEDEVSAEGLLKMWRDRGSPSETDEIIDILKQANFKGGEIKKAFKWAGVDTKRGTDPRITRLADAVREVKLDGYVVDYLKRMHNITSESVIFEKHITDKDIKQVIVKLVSSGNTDLSPDEKDEDRSNKNKQVHDFIQKWADDIESIKNRSTPYDEYREKGQEGLKGKQLTGSDGNTYTHNGYKWFKGTTGKGTMAKKEISAELNQRIESEFKAREKEFKADGNREIKALVKEIVNYLADRKGHDEWKGLISDVQGKLKKILTNPMVRDVVNKKIQQGATMESKSYILASKLLEQLGLTWTDLDVKPLKLNETQIVFTPSRRVDERSVEHMLYALDPNAWLGRRRKY